MEKIMERQCATTITAALQRGIECLPMCPALAELMVASAEPEFTDDPEGVLRHWVAARQSTEYAAEELLGTMYTIAQNDTHSGVGEYGAAVNAYFVLRAAMGMDECRAGAII